MPMSLFSLGREYQNLRFQLMAHRTQPRETPEGRDPQGIEPHSGECRSVLENSSHWTRLFQAPWTALPTIIHLSFSSTSFCARVFGNLSLGQDGEGIHKATRMLVQERVALDKYRTLTTPALGSVLCRGFNHALCAVRT